MANVRFQDQLGEALRAAVPFTYKPPDGIAANWRPADWLLCLKGRLIAVEAKQTRNPSWPWADWTPQQRAASELIERSGGLYWLVVNWRGAPGTRSGDTYTYALPGFVGREALKIASRKSITPAMCDHDLPGVRVHWVPGSGWDVQSFLPIGL